MVDDSHAVGFMGAGGRGTHELHDVIGRVDILTGTLGKAMGGASGGYVAARAEVVELLRQRSRPYLFSNSLAPPIAAASLRALDLIERSGELRERLAANTAHFRARMTELGFDILPGSHPIVPVMVGDAARAARLADGLHPPRRLRRQLLLPGRAAGHRPDPHADVGGPYGRRHRLRGRAVRGRARRARLADTRGLAPVPKPGPGPASARVRLLVEQREVLLGHAAGLRELAADGERGAARARAPRCRASC